MEFSTDDVCIEEDGRIVINNPALAKALILEAKKISPEQAGIFDNCNCSRNALSKVPLANAMPATTFKMLSGPSAGIFDNCDCGR